MVIEVDTLVESGGWSGLDLTALAERAVTAACLHRGVITAEVAVMGCDDTRIAELNADFREKPQTTNVLSWPSADRSPDTPGADPAPPEEDELGDIAIAWQTCEREAGAAGVPLADHATHLIVHATLHLLGYDHEDDADAERMESLEVEILAQMGLPDPYNRQTTRAGSMSDSDDAQRGDDAVGDDSPDADRGFFSRFFGRGAEDDASGDDDAEAQDDNGTTRGLMNLRRMRVSDVALPRVEIVAADKNATQDELVAVFRESGVTRLPVYDGTLDHPVGMVHLKDFALRNGFGDTAAFDMEAMLRPLIYAPPSMPIGVLLTRMQNERMHMALVIDEYGGVDGLLTIEDLIEQVIGEIEDEHDEDEDKMWVLEKPGQYLAQARAARQEFEAEIGIELVGPEDDEEIGTLGGVVVTLTGRVPARGEVIGHASGVEFEIVDADPRRLKRLRVRLPETG